MMTEEYMMRYLKRKVYHRVKRRISEAIMMVLVLAFLAGAAACHDVRPAETTPSESVYAADKFSVSAEIPLRYVVDGGEAGSNGGAETAGTDPESAAAVFILAPAAPGNPMPEGTEQGRKRLELRGSAETSFGRIVYGSPGVYDYSVWRESVCQEGTEGPEGSKRGAASGDTAVDGDSAVDKKANAGKDKSAGENESGDDLYNVRIIVTSGGESSLIVTKEGEPGKTELVYHGTGSAGSPADPDSGSPADPVDRIPEVERKGTAGRSDESDPDAPIAVSAQGQDDAPGNGNINGGGTGRPPPGSGDTGDSAPQTGDRAPLTLLVMLCVSALLCTGGVLAAARWRDRG